MTGSIEGRAVGIRGTGRANVAVITRQPVARHRLMANGAALFAIWLLATTLVAPSTAATYTWTNDTGTGLWADGGNWLPNFTSTPVQPLDLVFADGSGNGVNDLASGTLIRTMTFAATAEVHGFTSSNPGDPAANTMDIAAGGMISNASPNSQIIVFRLNLANALETNVTGAGTLILSNLSGGSNLTKTGTGSLTLAGEAFTGIYTEYTGNVDVLGGTLILGPGASLDNSTITSAAGTTLSGGGFAKMIVANGVVETGFFDGDNTQQMVGSLSTGNLQLAADSTTLFDINASQTSLPPNISNTSVLLTSLTGSAALNYAGGVSVEFANSNVYPIGTTWDLFAAAPGTTVDRTGVLSSFSTNGTGPYSGLSFTKVNPGTGSGDAIWQSDWAGSTDTKLVFNEATGQLVVVPEPSTIVFACIGAAMSGWSLVRRHRKKSVARQTNDRAFLVA